MQKVSTYCFCHYESLLLNSSFHTLYSYAAEQLQSLLRTIVIQIYHAFYSRLDNQFRALYAGGCRDV